MTRQLTALETEQGPAYVDLGSVVLVSTPFQKHGHDPARVIGLLGGHKVYALDSPFNLEVLKAMLPDTKGAVQAWQARTAQKAPGEAKTPKARTRKPRAPKDAPSEP